MLNRYLIKNGTRMSILDGSEEQCDILVEDGRIARIARQIDPAGAEVLDAEGRYVSAGWTPTVILPESATVRELIPAGTCFARESPVQWIWVPWVRMNMPDTGNGFCIRRI